MVRKFLLSGLFALALCVSHKSFAELGGGPAPMGPGMMPGMMGGAPMGGGCVSCGGGGSISISQTQITSVPSHGVPVPVPVPQPVPVPVPVARPIAYPVPMPMPVPYPMPYPVMRGIRVVNIGIGIGGFGGFGGFFRGCRRFCMPRFCGFRRGRCF